MIVVIYKINMMFEVKYNSYLCWVCVKENYEKKFVNREEGLFFFM